MMQGGKWDVVDALTSYESFSQSCVETRLDFFPMGNIMSSVATAAHDLDWESVLQTEGIEYVERGPNVARNHINIHCPWCGISDPSHHLGISLDGKGWGCWRDRTHRGRSPKRLLYKLLGSRAERYLPREEPEALLQSSGLGSRFTLTPTESEDFIDSAQWDRGFKFTHRLTRSDDTFLQYLVETRLLSADTVIRKGLRVAQYGPMSWRVFCPIHWEHKLVGWTARSIGNASPRYLVGPGRIDTLNVIREPFLDSPVILLEGYFDALRLWECSIGKEFGIIVTHGTALSQIKTSQLKKLSQTHPLIFALDDDAQHIAMEYSLAFDGWAVPPPRGRKDLGEATTGEIQSWIQQL